MRSGPASALIGRDKEAPVRSDKDGSANHRKRIDIQVTDPVVDALPALPHIERDRNAAARRARQQVVAKHADSRDVRAGPDLVRLPPVLAAICRNVNTVLVGISGKQQRAIGGKRIGKGI